MKWLLFVGLAASLFGATQEEKIASRFLAPCCWHENLAVHSSPVAEQMRAEIAGFVKEGKTEQEIVDYYVAQYGERILREPRGSRGIWLVVVPVLVALLGAALVTAYVNRMRHRPAVAGGPLAEIDDDWL